MLSDNIYVCTKTYVVIYRDIQNQGYYKDDSDGNGELASCKMKGIEAHIWTRRTVCLALPKLRYTACCPSVENPKERIL